MLHICFPTQTLEGPQKPSGLPGAEHSVIRAAGSGVSWTGLESWYNHVLANNLISLFLHLKLSKQGDLKGSVNKMMARHLEPEWKSPKWLPWGAGIMEKLSAFLSGSKDLWSLMMDWLFRTRLRATHGVI